MINTSNNLFEEVFDYTNNVVRYKEVDYPFRTISVDNECYNAIISVSSLNDIVFDQHDCWPDSLAEYIDNKILYYVEDADILKSDIQLLQILKPNLS